MVYAIICELKAQPTLSMTRRAFRFPVGTEETESPLVITSPPCLRLRSPGVPTPLSPLRTPECQNETIQDFEDSFTAQVEVHYTREVTVPSGYSREEEFELLESYKDAYMGSPTPHYKITGGEQADFAGYPALVFAGVDDGTERAEFTNNHIAFLADRKLWIFQCRYWPGLDELDGQLGNSCDGIIASVKSK